MRNSKTILLSVATAAAFGATAFVAPQLARADAGSDVSPAEMAGMRPLYKVTGGQFDFRDAYTFNALTQPGNTITTGSFNRVAYYVELSPTSAPTDHRWVWVSMDTFNTDPTKVGVPQQDSNIVERGTVVTNLHVESGHPNVTAGNSAYGDIEFWSSNYNQNGSEGGADPLGSNNGNYDWKDGGERSTGPGHGSFQVFALTGNPTSGFTNGKTLFGITANSGAGLGDQPPDNNPASDISHSPDWTFGPGTGSYTVRNLEIFVNTVPEPTSVGMTLGLGALGLVRRRRNA